MNILGVGPLEFVLVLLVMFLVLGPKDMVKAGKKLGQFLNVAKRSEIWNGVTRVNKSLRDLPTNLMREAELDEFKKEWEQDATLLKSVSEEFQINDLNRIVAERKASIEQALNQVDEVSIDGSAVSPRLKE
jgi:Sec-independent protein translocase protein TatA